MVRKPLDRRRFLTAGAGLVGATALAGCDRLAGTRAGQRALQAGEDASLYVQRLLLSPQSLAPEYAKADMSPIFKANGTSDPPDGSYKALAKKSFADYRLKVGGLVEHPFEISLADLRAMPARTQVTRHDCVEGWSCIGEWTGVPLRDLLQRAALKPEARYVVLHCFDTMEGGEASGDDDDSGETSNPQMEQKQQASQPPEGGSKPRDSKEAQSSDVFGGGQGGSAPVRYYESIDLTDAYHPQTILAHSMNGQVLPIAHGAPLRLRVERQLGYKMAKYVQRIEVVESYVKFGQGRGGYWEDRGYDWYAGI